MRGEANSKTKLARNVQLTLQQVYSRLVQIFAGSQHLLSTFALNNCQFGSAFCRVKYFISKMVGYFTFNLHFHYCWWILHKNVSSGFLFIFSAFVSQSSIKDDEIFEPSSSSFSFMLRLIFSLLHQSAKFKLQNWTYHDIKRKYPHISENC